MKTLLHKYKHAWVFLYAFIYFPWFCYLEKNVTNEFHIIHTALDEKIPFVELFVIPYLLWFGFITFAALYFFFTDQTGFYRMAAFMITGMTVFLIISTIYPNGQILRPTEFARDNIFVDMVRHLYEGDTPTNIFPSIHAYNSIGVHLAVRNSERLKKNRLAQHGTFVLSVLIILSTMFLKQHSILDVIGAIVLAVPAYYLAYVWEPKGAHAYKKASNIKNYT